MGCSKALVYFTACFYLISLASAATIHGSVYDFSLKKLGSVIVEINTTTKQLFVVQNGSYSFNVPNGAYSIKAKSVEKNEAITHLEENVTISQDGSYILDLILYPDFGEFEGEISKIDTDKIMDETNKIQNNKYQQIIFVVIILLFIFVIILIGAYYFNKGIKQKKSQDKLQEKAEKPKSDEKYEGDDLERIIKIIKQEGGRTTQKEIRKQIPLSEAKISLMIAELEHKGIIEKIKKGRGNIIILKNKE